MILDNSSSNTSYEFSKLGAKKSIFCGLSFKALNFAALKTQRGFYPKMGFGTHFHGVPKIVLEVVYSKYGYSGAGRGSLRGFCDRRAPKRFRHQIGPIGPLASKNRHFRRFFSSGVPGGCTYFSERPALQTHPIGPYLREKSCPTSI